MMLCVHPRLSAVPYSWSFLPSCPPGLNFSPQFLGDSKQNDLAVLQGESPRLLAIILAETTIGGANRPITVFHSIIVVSPLLSFDLRVQIHAVSRRPRGDYRRQ